ncbi:MAG: hypothetical protein LV480_09920 [Methylacidiphilales bacterium]|nr:hypothetical protein [Candidatus Methylacidiphilales bacterium]
MPTKRDRFNLPIESHVPPSLKNIKTTQKTAHSAPYEKQAFAEISQESEVSDFG